MIKVPLTKECTECYGACVNFDNDTTCEACHGQGIEPTGYGAEIYKIVKLLLIQEGIIELEE